MANNMKFDKIRYIELLKKQELSFLDENRILDKNLKEELELLSYQNILQNQIYYNRKVEYIF